MTDVPPDFVPIASAERQLYRHPKDLQWATLYLYEGRWHLEMTDVEGKLYHSVRLHAQWVSMGTCVQLDLYSKDRTEFRKVLYNFYKNRALSKAGET
jgi:hypothetical protein